MPPASQFPSWQLPLLLSLTKYGGRGGWFHLTNLLAICSIGWSIIHRCWSQVLYILNFPNFNPTISARLEAIIISHRWSECFSSPYFAAYLDHLSSQVIIDNSTLVMNEATMFKGLCPHHRRSSWLYYKFVTGMPNGAANLDHTPHVQKICIEFSIAFELVVQR